MFADSSPEDEVYDLDRKRLGDEDPDVLNDLSNIGSILLQQEKFTPGEATFRQVLEAKRRVLGPEHPSTLLTMGNLALASGTPQALLRSRTALPTGPRNQNQKSRPRQLLHPRYETTTRGPEQSDTLLTQHALADVLATQHHYPEAETLFRQTLALQIKVLTAHHPNTAHTECSLAQVLALQGKRDEAFVHLQACLDDGPAPSELQDSLADDALNSLRSDPRFAAIHSRAKQLTSVSSQ